MERLILASNSPRRREILSQAGFTFEVIPAAGEEKSSAGDPGIYVEELSEHKASEVFLKELGKAPEEALTVIGADTIVVVTKEDGSFEILGKPADKEDARRMIGELQGASHRVMTGVTLLWQDEHGEIGKERFHEETYVDVCDMSEEEIEAYISTKEPYDKAGAYAIQGRFGVFIRGIRGCYYNVVGLPAARLYHVLKRVMND